MKTNVERIQDKADKEIGEIEGWLKRLNYLRYLLFERRNESGKENYDKNSHIIQIAEHTVKYDPNYWQVVNVLLNPIYEELELVDDMDDED